MGWFLTPLAEAQTASDAIISEFRFHGPTSDDEYVEIYNTLGSPLNISRWSIQTKAAGTGILQSALVPDNTIVPARGHFLFTGSGYSLSGYGAGNALLGADASDDSGVALFNAAGAVQDAAGFTTSDAALREGAGLPSAPTSNGQFAFVRDFTGSVPKDSGDNAGDFILVSTEAAGTAGNAGAPALAGTNGALTARLGAPSPEGLSSPAYANGILTTLLFDPNVDLNVSPNRERVGSGDSGTVLFRRSLTNNSSRSINRVRFTLIRVTSLGSPTLFSPQADLRLTTSSNESAVMTSAGALDVSGTTLEADGSGATAGPSQPLGGGLASSLSFNMVLNTPLAPGEKRAFSFLFNIAKAGSYNVLLNVEALSSPAAITDLSAAPGNNQVALSWTGVSGAASYKVFRSTTAGTYDFTTPLATGITANTYTDTTATNGTTYFYVVRATNGGGDGPNSNEVSAIPSAPFLSNFTVSPTAVYGGNNAIGTVTLSSPAPAGGVTVTLNSNAAAAVVSPSVQIASGQTTAFLTVAARSVSETTSVVITASYGDFTQASTLTVMSAGQTFDVLNLSAAPGNACVTLTWSALPDGTVQGYNIYRKVAGGTTTRVNTSQINGTTFVDSALSNGTTYQYQVSAVIYNGTETGQSSWVSATPSNTFPVLTWVNPPSSASDQIVFQAVTSTGVWLSGANLFVDNEQFAPASSTGSPSEPSGTLTVNLDTTLLSDGVHTFQIIGYYQGSVCATSPLSLQVNNSFNVLCESDLDVGVDLLHVQVVVPQGVIWRVDVLKKSDGTVIRSWGGSQSSHFAWDGTDSTGNLIDSYGSIDIQLTDVTPSGGTASPGIAAGGQVFLPKHRTVQPYSSANNPDTLLLIAQPDPGTIDAQYASDLRIRLNSAASADSSFHPMVLYASAPVSRKLRQKVKFWMSASVVNFYIYNHGTAPSNVLPLNTYWGGMNFWAAELPSDQPVYRSTVTHPDQHVVVPLVVGARIYNFVMIDTCWSAGGNSDGSQSTFDNAQWTYAFNIGNQTNVTSCFVGFNGTAGGNTFDTGPKAGQVSEWFYWREHFWFQLAQQAFVSQAYTIATQRTNSDGYNPNPWDYGKFFQYDDTQLR